MDICAKIMPYHSVKLARIITAYLLCYSYHNLQDFLESLTTASLQNELVNFDIGGTVVVPLTRKFHEFSSRDRGEEFATGQPSRGTAGLDPRRT